MSLSGLRFFSKLSRNFWSDIKFKFHPNSPVVTILGSCRQDSLYKKFQVTAIRDGLTYPHYANEVLQLVRYCTSKTEIEFSSPYVFRNDCIGAKKISHKKAYKDFKKTDIFVIEISSLLEYSHNGHFIHHEAFDRPESLKKIGLSSIEFDHKEIRVTRQRLSDLEPLLSEIVRLIGNTRIVFVSNLSNRTSGGRAELNAFVKQFSEANNCAYFDPSELLIHYKLEDICKTEPVISHFTERGHELVGIRLSTIINRTYLQNAKSKKLLIQKYRAFPRNEEIHGLGDFLYGCLKILEVTKSKNLIPVIDFSTHPMSKFLPNKQSTSEDVTTIFHTQSDKPLQKGGVFFTNLRPEKNPSKEALQFLLSEVLTPDLDFREALQLKMREQNLRKGQYVVFHVRVGDKSFEDGILDEKLLTDVVTFISKSILNYGEEFNSLVISDSKELVDALKIAKIQTGSITSTHFGDSRGSNESIRETLIDFFLLLGAQKIVQISSYSWGSSFSDIPSMLFDIPMERHKISEI